MDIAGAERLAVINRVSLIQPLPCLQGADRGPPRGRGRHPRQLVRRRSTRTPRTSSPSSRSSPTSWRAMYTEFQVAEPVEGVPRRPAGRGGREPSSPSASAGRWATASRSRRPASGRDAGNSTCVGSTAARVRRTTRPRSGSSTGYSWSARRATGKGIVGWYVVRVADPDAGGRGQGHRRRFANSSSETRTQTESAFAASFVKQMGNIEFLILADRHGRVLDAAARHRQHHGDRGARAHRASWRC